MELQHYNKELLTIVEALKLWCLLLEGLRIPVVIYMDHQNLQYWKEAQIMDRKHAHWYTELASYNFFITY